MLSKVSQTPSQARSFSGCTPPARNDVATVVTAPAASGLGACIHFLSAVPCMGPACGQHFPML